MSEPVWSAYTTAGANTDDGAAKWTTLADLTVPATPTPAIDLDLTNPATASQLTCVRSTVGYHDNLAGVWSSFPVNTPRITDRGLRSEEARTNSIRNNSGQGVVGSPPTLPNFWSFVHAGGIIDPASVSTGVENGIEYVDIRIVGAAGLGFELDLESVVAAVNGQTWFASAFFAIKSGSPPAGLYFGIGLFNGASWLGDLGTILLSTFTSTLTRYTIGGKIANASVNGVQPYFYVDPSASATDFTIRIGWPQMELARNSGTADLPWSTSPIRTTSAAVTRAEDRVTVNGFVSWYTPGSPGTVFVEGKDDAPLVNYSSPVFIGDWNGTYIEVAYDVDSSFVLLWDGAVQIGLTVVNDPVHYRTATAWALNDGQYYFNGKASTHDTSVALPIFPTSPSTASVVALGVSYTGGYGLSGPLTRFTYWNSRLPDSLLGKLTGKGNWAAPHARLANAFAANWGGAGDKFFVGDDHAETQATALTITSSATFANQVEVFCVDKGGSVPPVDADLRRSASIRTTGDFGLTFDAAGGTLIDGVSLYAGSGNVPSPRLTLTGTITIKNAMIGKLSTMLTWTAINIHGRTILDNVGFHLGHWGDEITGFSNVIEWRNTPVAIVGDLPTSFFSWLFIGPLDLTVSGVDLSPFGADGALFTPYGDGWGSSILVTGCKIPPENSLINTYYGDWGPGGSVTFLNCDSGAAYHRTEKQQLEGTQVVETTVVRAGGATDLTTPISWLISTSSSAGRVNPYNCLPLSSVWGSFVGPRTVIIHGYWDSPAPPTNADIWIEADYLADASSTIVSTASSGSHLVPVPYPVDTDSVWGGPGTGTRFKMSVDLTVGGPGLLGMRIKAAKPSAFFYVDPEPEISGVTFGRSMVHVPGVYVNELGGGGVPFSRLQLGH